MVANRDEKDIGEAEPSLPKPAPKPDQITAAIGEVGKWQVLKILIVFLASAPGLSHIFNSAFIAPKVAFWCNKFATEWQSETRYYDVDNGRFPVYNETGIFENGTQIILKPTSYEQCSFNTTTTPPNATTYCSEYAFDHSFWETTIITEFDLVCEKKALPYLAKSIIFSGLALGSFVSGLVSDRFGRKKAIWFSSVTMLVAGILTSVMPWYPLFVFFWLITGTMAISCYTAAFVWTMELTTGKWKIYLGMAMNYSWPTCRLIIAGLTWNLREWRNVLRAISGIVAFGSVILFWLPESPRWLIAKGRIPEAQKILADARKFNGDPIDEDKIELRKPAATGAAQGSFFDIVKHPILRWQVLIMYFNWFTTALIMYGLALSWKELTGGLYLNFIIGTLLDFPAKTLAMILVLKVGRKYPYMAGSAITGTMFLITIFIPRDYFPGNWPIVVLALIGNFCTTMCFAILYMYSGELMPTTVRAAGVGSCSLVSKVGGVASTTVAALATYHIAIPNILFASLALTSAVITIMVPETKGRPMPETLDDVDRKHFFEKRRNN